MRRRRTKVISALLGGLLLAGIVLAAVNPRTRSGTSASTEPATTPTTISAPTLSSDAETNVRNACTAWASIGEGTTKGTMTPQVAGATLGQVVTLAEAAATASTSYQPFALSTQAMLSAFMANDQSGLSTNIAAINAVCAVPHQS